MTTKRHEAVIFQPNGRKKQWTVRSLLPNQVVTSVGDLLGEEAAKKAEETFRAMDKNGLEFVQLRMGDRRVRFYQEEIA